MAAAQQRASNQDGNSRRGFGILRRFILKPL
jgi:hypothetical protein